MPAPRIGPVAPAPVTSLGGVANPATYAQAQADTLVRFGPQENALKRLMTQAYSDLFTRVSVAKSTAAGVQKVAELVRPAMEQAYTRAGSTIENAGEDLSDDLDKLGKSADPFRAATARESAGARTRLAEGMAGALSELESRRMDAAAGGQFAVNKAYSQFGSDKADVTNKWLEVQAAKGPNTLAVAGKITEADQKARAEAAKQQELTDYRNAQLGNTQASQQETARHNRAIEAKGAGGAGAGAYTPEANRNARADINKLWTFLRPKSQKARLWAIGQIMQGTTQVGTGAGAVKLPGVRNGLYAQAAYDLVQYGRLHSSTYHRLREDGFAVPAPWMPRRPRTAPAGRPVFGRPVGTIRGTA